MVFEAPVNPDDVVWKQRGHRFLFNRQPLYQQIGLWFYSGICWRCKSILRVTVLPTQSIAVDGFEKQNASFLPYPIYSKRLLYYNNEQKHSGNSSKAFVPF